MATDTVTATVTRNGVSAPLESAEGHALIEGAVRDALGDSLEHMPYPIPEADNFQGAPGGYIQAEDLPKIADQLMRDWHQYVGHAAKYAITWLWKGKANRRGWTKPAKDLLGFFAPEVDFVIWLGADMLREEQFTYRQVSAQVFHELLHIVEEGGKVGVRSDHDFEGFVPELEVFGPWTAELAQTKRALDRAPKVGMGPLFDRDDDEDDDVGI